MQRMSLQSEWHSVRVAGNRVQYQVLGAGEPVVLVHGLCASTYWWSRNIEALAERHRVYAVDLPGFGSMRHLRRSFVLARAAHWLRQWLDVVGLDRVHLVGHSMGGYICMQFAASSPQRVDRLVVVAPSGIPTYPSILHGAMPLLAASLTTTPSFLPILAYDAMRTGPITLIQAARQVVQGDIRDSVARITAPTLLIWGTLDPLFPPASGVALQSLLPTAQVLVMPRAGHVLMYDQSRTFNAALQAFLAGDDLPDRGASLDGTDQFVWPGFGLLAHGMAAYRRTQLIVALGRALIEPRQP